MAMDRESGPRDKNGTPGVLLIGHGTREPRGVAAFQAVCQRVAADFAPVAVEPCFLELSEPSVSDGVGRLLDAGVRRIVVAPLLLFAAGHARRDIPQAVAEALHPYPEVRWSQSRHLGCHPAILQQSAIRFEEAVAGRPSVACEQTVWLFVGRGSQDAQATQEAHTFAVAAPQSGAARQTIVCFYAMARPSLHEVLESCVQVGCRRIVVQPHLLFEGQIAESIRGQVRAAGARHPHIEWIVTGPLGPTDLVAQAVSHAVRREQSVAAKSPATR